MSFHDRKAEKRKARLDDIDDRVADGSLRIRKMTDDERQRFGLDDSDRSFRRFFFAGSRPGTQRGEGEYQRVASAVRAETGDRPTQRRIFRVDCSIDGRPRRLQVGDPIDEGAGDVISAIFELRDGGDLVVSTPADAVALRVAAAGAEVVEFA